MNDIDMLIHERVLNSFEEQSCSTPLRLEIVSQTDSTNRFVLDAALNGACTGFTCIAESQTAGRGRRGKLWASPTGNIYASILWRFDASFAQISGLSLAVGVAVADLLSSYHVEGVTLKWPNDVLCVGHKICGILIETARADDGQWLAVIGIGLNVRMDEGAAGSIDQAWTDLHSQCPTKPERSEVAGRLIATVFDYVTRFATEGLSCVLPRWRHYDSMLGREVSVLGPIGEERGIARGIDDSGALVVDFNGVERRVMSGDVSLRSVVKC